MHKELVTEACNPASADLDRLSTLDFVRLVNSEDAKLASAVADQAKEIADAIDLIADRLAGGGRLIYVGAGTSGRLGVLDASECPPTFSADPEQVIGLIAGGSEALQRAVEGAEDSAEQGVADLQAIRLSECDVVVGIATSGHTPYVLGALKFARDAGAGTVGFSCNPGSPVAEKADVGISVAVGPEVLSGSTRMKAGTATKMVLNMLTTGAMVKLGKTYGNLMVDLQATNNKLVQRSINIMQQLTELSESDARELLESCGGELKTGIVCHRFGVSPEIARAKLEAVDGRLRSALGDDE
ncbi:MAG: N-acetylmuramic acid 6-phosphate etherase [Woeseiaceae bacterium]|nr:N-acetylmuramic acid 6-phosphate etherase [Woeseiaceae bacterium]MDX2608333.1 N-acetylmuramic acid 6-phosphate etherase [Woeseiaceae bacterium]